MGILDTVKDVVELIQKTDNIPLLRQIITLQQELMVLVKDKGDLSARVETLEKTLKVRGDLVFKHSLYWMKDTDEGPFCSTCWDTNYQLVRMISNGRVPSAVKCGKCSALVSLPRPLIDKALGLNEQEDLPGNPCPRCRRPTWRLESSKPDPLMGAVGIMQRDYKCSSCGFAESRKEE